MVRPTGKQPHSAHEVKPSDYEPPVGEVDRTSASWRWRWNVPAVWCDYSKAMSYWQRHTGSVEGLCFVLHPAGDLEPRTRTIVVDFDKAVTNGDIDDHVADCLQHLNTWTELSRSGRGLHAIVNVLECPAFVNNPRKPIGGCTVDILCSAQVALTGNVVNESPVRSITFAELCALPFFDFKPAVEAQAKPDWWSEDPLDDVKPGHAYLIESMTIAEAVEGHGAYHQMLFACACTLARHGVTGREAEPLLRCIPATPPFDEDEIQRAIDCAYTRVEADGQFKTEGFCSEFDVIPQPSTPVSQKGLPIPGQPQTVAADDDSPMAKYGFEPIPIEKLVRMDLKLEWLVDRVLIGKGPLIIGGREKCFKTSLAMDLAVSLATQTKWLGEFQVNHMRETAFFTAEIAQEDCQELSIRIMEAKGLDPMAVRGFDIVPTVPSMAINRVTQQPADMKAFLGLKRYLQERKPNVAMFDPLYWALGGSSVGDMYEIGMVLRKISDLCTEMGVWPIFCHHAVKGTSEDEGRPMKLGDLYGTGVQQFARQWLLVSHAEEFRDGKADLWLNMGGSSGKGDRGLWRLGIDEGQSDEIMGRQWDLEIGQEEREEMAISDEKLLDAIEAHDDGKGAMEAAIMYHVDRKLADVQKALRRACQNGLIMMKPGKKFSIREVTDETFANE